MGAVPEIETRFDATPLTVLPPAVASDLAQLPACDTWVNLRDLGAKGDGQTDDTAVLQKAIDDHRTIYLPSGFYVVRDTLKLKSDTVLIGLHPGATQIILPDGTPAYQGIGAPKALLEAPKGGSNIVIGIGLYTGGNNRRAVAALWKAGANSMMNDVRFLGGHGTPLPDGSRQRPYNESHNADPDPEPPLGQPVSQPLGHRRRRRNIPRYLDAFNFCPGGDGGFRHRNSRARLPDFERASCPPRGSGAQCGPLELLCVANGRRARRKRLLPAD